MLLGMSLGMLLDMFLDMLLDKLMNRLIDASSNMLATSGQEIIDRQRQR